MSAGHDGTSWETGGWTVLNRTTALTEAQLTLDKTGATVTISSPVAG